MDDYKSVFDIIGPVMVGPSSSHTAGAVKIGKIARRIFDKVPTRLDVTLYGSFATTYKGHGSDVAFVAGALDYDTDDPRIVNSLNTAKDLGISINFYVSDESVDYPNTAKLKFYDGSQSMEFTGVSIGGGKVKIIKIDGFTVDFTGDNPGLIVIHMDRYGVIFSVTKVLTKYAVNISHMEVLRTKKSEQAIMCIETDENISEEILHEIEAEKNIIKVIGMNM